MNINFELNTGSSTLSGCRSLSRISNYYASTTEQTIYFNNTITGDNSTKLSLNSQTLTEGPLEIVDLAFEDLYLSSGDYYLLPNTNKVASITNDLTLNEIEGDITILYESRPQASGAIFIFSNSGEVNTGLKNQINLNLPTYTNNLSALDFFLNGQKIYSGESYTITGANNGFSYLSNVTGKIFAIPKYSNLLNITGESGQVYATEFIENNNAIYLNGMEQASISWLEINTGVNMIVKNNPVNFTIDNPFYQTFAL